MTERSTVGSDDASRSPLNGQPRAPASSNADGRGGPSFPTAGTRPVEHGTRREYLTLIENSINNFVKTLDGHPERLYEAARHILTAGGKRIRPLVVLLACDAVGGDTIEALPFALAAELIHTASLLHDDVIDDDRTRRGVDTSHLEFGRRMAVIAGDLLVAKAIQTVGERASPEVIARLGSSGVRMCEGEASDLLAEERMVVSMDDYLNLIGLKTAAFIREAAWVGATVGGGSTAQQEALSIYGEMLGYAFQIRDDILNVIGPEERLGKPTLSDLKKKRGNVLLVYALEMSSPREKKTYIGEIEKGNIDYALSLIESTGAVDHAMGLGRRYVERAKSALASVDLRYRDLLGLADFIIERWH